MGYPGRRNSPHVQLDSYDAASSETGLEGQRTRARPHSNHFILRRWLLEFPPSAPITRSRHALLNSGSLFSSRDYFCFQKKRVFCIVDCFPLTIAPPLKNGFSTLLSPASRPDRPSDYSFLLSPRDIMPIPHTTLQIIIGNVRLKME